MVHADAWNCTCAVFAIAAFPPISDVGGDSNDDYGMKSDGGEQSAPSALSPEDRHTDGDREDDLAVVSEDYHATAENEACDDEEQVAEERGGPGQEKEQQQQQQQSV